MDIISKQEAVAQGLTLFFTGKPCKYGHISPRYSANYKCIVCASEKGKDWKIANAGHIKQQRIDYYKANAEHLNHSSALWRESNIDHVKQQNSEYRSTNSERLKQQGKLYYNTNIDRCRQSSRNWQKKNSESNKIKNKRRRLAKLEHYNYKCQEWKRNNPEYCKQSGTTWRRLNPHKTREFSNIRNTKLYKAIPRWYNEKQVRLVYLKRDELNQKWGVNFQVDHIIPLNPRCGTVCGLHCWENLQLLDQSENAVKGSKYQQDW
jgi:hypothetical protein